MSDARDRTMNANAPATNYYVAQCLEALSELKAKDFPVPQALTVDAPQPLALTTREDIGAYVALHGGGADEARLLGQIVAALTRTPRYVEALAADLSVRVSILTGEPHGLVSEMDRHSAALLIHTKAVRSPPKPAGVRDAAPGQPKPPQTQSPKPPAPAAANKPASTTPPAASPFRNGGQLSAGEIEKRKQALAALKPKTATPP
jgi:hypothetical protein